MKGDREIGIATLAFNQEGEAVDAVFAPSSYKVDASQVIAELKKAKAKDEKQIKEVAQTVLADWFSHLNKIEEADREESEIVAEILSCRNWPNGTPMICKIRFVLRPRNEAAAQA